MKNVTDYLSVTSSVSLHSIFSTSSFFSISGNRFICLQSTKILDADKILCKINTWQCYKWLGEYDKVRDEVKKVDVSAFKPMYTLGILA